MVEWSKVAISQGAVCCPKLKQTRHNYDHYDDDDVDVDVNYNKYYHKHSQWQMIWQIKDNISLPEIKAKTTQIWWKTQEGNLLATWLAKVFYRAMWRQEGKHETEIDRHRRQNQEELSLKYFQLDTFEYFEFQTFERNVPKSRVHPSHILLKFEVTNDCEENAPRMRMVGGRGGRWWAQIIGRITGEVCRLKTTCSSGF